MNMNECLPYDNIYYNYPDYYYEQEYNYYNEPEDYNTNYRPDYYDNSIAHYDTNNDLLLNETEPQSEAICTDQDFRSDQKSPKPK